MENMKNKPTLTLLTGSQVNLGASHTAIVPEVVSLSKGDIVDVENDKHEYLGTVEITDVQVHTFALLQNRHLAGVSHPDMTTWPNALSVLSAQVPDFSQLDKVSTVTFFAHAVSGAGLTVGAAVESEPPVVEAESEAPPSEEDQYAALGEPIDIEGNNA